MRWRPTETEPVPTYREEFYEKTYDRTCLLSKTMYRNYEILLGDRIDQRCFRHIGKSVKSGLSKSKWFLYRAWVFSIITYRDDSNRSKNKISGKNAIQLFCMLISTAMMPLYDYAAAAAVDNHLRLYTSGWDQRHHDRNSLQLLWISGDRNDHRCSDV